MTDYENLEYSCEMTPGVLNERIRKAQEEWDQLPNWVKQNAYWAGGGECRGEQEDTKSYGNY